MNYYEHHIRDYDAATSHLSWDEDLAYMRLIRWYYRKEKPLPADIKEACRQVRAVTKAQRDAVESVLKEFFDLHEDGWHNETCDDAIARFKDGEPEREIKKANEENRTKRHREERARLFKTLTDAGGHAPWNIGIADLRELVSKTTATKPVTENEPPVTQPVTAPATLVTATQSPDTNHQTPVLTSVPNGTGADAPPPVDPVAEMKKEIWHSGKALFASKDIPAEKSGKILGQLLNEYSVEIVLEAVRAGVKAETPDPTSYLTACCQRTAGERAKVQKQSRHSGFDKTDYSEGVTADGRIA